jgi:hypothetical protein
MKHGRNYELLAGRHCRRLDEHLDVIRRILHHRAESIGRGIIALNILS